MTFIETFTAVFMATTMAQVSTWWFKKELEHRLDRHYDKIKRALKPNIGGETMRKLRLNIELTTNNKYIVDVVVREGTLMTKPEVETASFNDIKELGTWLESKLKA